MSVDWDKIGAKILSLYEEMAYHPEYTVERFIDDFTIEVKKTKAIPERSEYNDDYLNWISQFRDVLESSRSILTKLFSLTNNVNNFDTLIECCDYYKSYYDVNRIEYIPMIARLSMDPSSVFRYIFIMMAENETTKPVLDAIWNHLCTNIRYTRFVTELDFQPRPIGSVAMVVMADSDLNAAAQTLIRSDDTQFRISKILVQEPVKEQFLSVINNSGFKFEIFPNLYVFRNTVEVLENFSGEDEFELISLWSENIIAAKKLAENLKINTIWINACGVLGAGFRSILYMHPRSVNYLQWNADAEEDNDSSKTPLKPAKTFDLFYGGKWQVPADGEYWTNSAGVSFALATKKDISSCAVVARRAFKLWSSKKLSQRTKIIRCFAERLRANGESEYADIVLQCVNWPSEFGTSLSIVRDGEAEILSTFEPVGVVLIAPASDQKMLFAKLIIACVAGNAVIVLLNSKHSVSFAPYCDLLATCGFPPGVINCLFTRNHPSNIELPTKITDTIIPESSETLSSAFSNLYKDQAATNIIYNKFFISVTKPKSIWLQCA